MRNQRYIWIVLAALVLTGCGAKKKIVATEPTVVVEPEIPAWHTCLIQGARMTVVTDDQELSAAANLQVVRDSMLVISVMPMLGMEMLRIEATPQQVVGIDKMHAQYAIATYDEINSRLMPSVSWATLQQLCSAELPSGDKKAVLQYNFGRETIRLTVEYPARQTDVPVRVQGARLDKYKKIDISKFL